MFRKIIFLLAIVIVSLFLLIVFTTDGLATLGKMPNPDDIQAKAQKSIYLKGKFQNPVSNVMGSHRFFSVLSKFLLTPSGKREPHTPLPVEPIDIKLINSAPKDSVRITWLGHAALLIEIEGFKLLTDPVFSRRASPLQWMGPKRFHPVPILTDELPELDAVIISHDHYDHLDYQTIKELAPRTKHFLVPLGVGSHLKSWGIDDSKITERDWWQQVKLNDVLTFIATPAQHFSGRSLFDRNKTLWTSWVILADKHRIYFSGDTGMFDTFKEIGDRYGPFDFTLLHVGAYSDEWPNMHMTPEQAVQAHLQLKGKVFVPIHWGTFNLAFHDWNEPAERLYREARQKKLSFVIPKAGQHISKSNLPTLERWWRHAGGSGLVADLPLESIVKR